MEFSQGLLVISKGFKFPYFNNIISFISKLKFSEIIFRPFAIQIESYKYLLKLTVKQDFPIFTNMHRFQIRKGENKIYYFCNLIKYLSNINTPPPCKSAPLTV